jgi:hypothetical protein
MVAIHRFPIDATTKKENFASNDYVLIGNVVFVIIKDKLYSQFHSLPKPLSHLI